MKKYLLILAILLTLTVARGQTWQWAKNAGDTLNDYATSTSTDISGNVYVTGYFYSQTITFGTFTLTNSNIDTSDIFIAKYDANGTVLWATSAGGRKNDLANSIATDPSGNVYITGYFLSDSITFGSITLMNTHNNAYYIVKYDSNGNAIWAKTAGGISPYNWGNAVTTDNFGNVYAVGNFGMNSIVFGTTTLNGSGAWDLFIVKYDNNGNVLWAKKGGAGDNDEANGVTTDLSGNIFMVGSYGSPTITFGTTTLTNPGSFGARDMYIVKYDSTGNALWANGGGGTQNEYAKSVASDGLGNVVVAGSFNSASITFGITTLTNTNAYSDIYIVKYDNNGNVLWAKSATGNSFDQGNSVSIDVSGNSYLTGYFVSDSITFGAFTLTNFADTVWSYDIFVTKYDGSGNEVWAVSVGDSTYEEATSISTDASGNIYVAGYSYSDTLIFGFDTLFIDTTNNASDMFIAKMGIVTGIQNLINDKNISIYPNPFSTQTVLQTNNLLHNATLTVYNCFGQQVKQFIISRNEFGTGSNSDLPTGQAGSFVIRRDNLSSGLYFLRLTEGNKTLAAEKLLITD